MYHFLFFILVCTTVFASFENMGFIANAVSLVMYFMNVMHFDLAGSSNTLTNFMGTTFLLSLVGGFISDTFLSRLETSLIFGTLEVLVIDIWLTNYILGLNINTDVYIKKKKEKRKKKLTNFILLLLLLLSLQAFMLITIQAGTHHLQPKIGLVEGGKAVWFYGSLYLLALGSGGVRGSLPPLGADQFDRHNPKEAKALATFFNWFLLSITIGASVGVTAIVYLSTKVGWQWGFMVSTLAILLAFIVLALGKPYYRLRAPGNSPLLSIIQVFYLLIFLSNTPLYICMVPYMYIEIHFVGLCLFSSQVIVVSIKNRGKSVPENPAELYEEKDSLHANEKLPHTNQFR